MNLFHVVQQIYRPFQCFAAYAEIPDMHIHQFFVFKYDVDIIPASELLGYVHQRHVVEVEIPVFPVDISVRIYVLNNESFSLSLTCTRPLIRVT